MWNGADSFFALRKKSLLYQYYFHTSQSIRSRQFLFREYCALAHR